MFPYDHQLVFFLFHAKLKIRWLCSRFLNSENPVKHRRYRFAVMLFCSYNHLENSVQFKSKYS